MTLAVVAISFTISNDAMIRLSLWPFNQSLEIPTWLFGTGAFVTGGILGVVLMGGQMLTIRAKLWRAQSQIIKLDKQASQTPEAHEHHHKRNRNSQKPQKFANA